MIQEFLIFFRESSLEIFFNEPRNTGVIMINFTSRADVVDAVIGLLN